MLMKFDEVSYCESSAYISSSFPLPHSLPLSSSILSVPASVSTPPFSSEEESIGDSAYITSPSRPTPSVRLVQSGPQQTLNPPQGPSSAPTDDWSDSDLSEEVAGTSTQQGLSTQGGLLTCSNNEPFQNKQIL